MEVPVDVVDLESERLTLPATDIEAPDALVGATNLGKGPTQDRRFGALRTPGNHDQNVIGAQTAPLPAALISHEVLSVDAVLLDRSADVGMGATRLIQTQVTKDAGN
ncbi:MAG: hypothetical protein WB767_06975 [Nocardioides sp.]